MKKNLAIALFLLLIPAAFKAGEWTSKTFPEIFSFRVVSFGLLICFMVLALTNHIMATASSYEAGKKDGEEKANPKPE